MSHKPTLLYRLNKRNAFYASATFICDIFMLFMLYFPTFYSDGWMFALLFVLWILLLYVLFSSVLFKNLEIFQDEIKITYRLFGSLQIDAKDICTTVNSNFGISWLVGETLIIKKKSKFIKRFYLIRALTSEQSREIETAIKKLVEKN